MEVALRRTLIGTVALAVLAAGLAVSASEVSATKYRGRMVEAPPGAPNVREPLSFKVVKAKQGRAARKRPGRARLVSDFRFRRLAGTECALFPGQDDLTVDFDDLTQAVNGSDFLAWQRGAKVRRNGSFTLRYSFPILALVVPDEIVGKTADAVVSGTLKPNGIARGRARLRITDPGTDEVVCDSYGERRWRAKSVRR